MENNIEEKAKAYWNSFDLIKHDKPMDLFAHGAIYGYTTCTSDIVKVIEEEINSPNRFKRKSGYNQALTDLLTKLKTQAK